MAEEAWLVDTMGFGNGASTAAAGGTGQRAFDGEDDLAMLVHLGLEDAHVGDVKRNRDQWVLR